MNSKGQVLVMFIIILPVLLIIFIPWLYCLLYIFALVAELGLSYIEKRNISSNTYDAVEYYLKNQEDPQIDSKVKILLNKNIDDIDEIKINNTDSFIEIAVTKKNNSIYNKILNNSVITVTYKGLKNYNKIIKGW